MNDSAMEIASVLLRLGALRRDDPEHQLIYEELGKDPVLNDAVRRLPLVAAAAAVGGYVASGKSSRARRFSLLWGSGP